MASPFSFLFFLRLPIKTNRNAPPLFNSKFSQRRAHLSHYFKTICTFLPQDTFPCFSFVNIFSPFCPFPSRNPNPIPCLVKYILHASPLPLRLLPSLAPLIPINDMEGSGSGHRPNGVVSGKGYTGRPGSPGGVPIPGSVNRGIQSAPKPWGFKDPESERKKRIAKYKVYAVEGKVKTSLRKGLRWIKNKCSQIVHGY